MGYTDMQRVPPLILQKRLESAVWFTEAKCQILTTPCTLQCIVNLKPLGSHTNLSSLSNKAKRLLSEFLPAEHKLILVFPLSAQHIIG